MAFMNDNISQVFAHYIENFVKFFLSAEVFCLNLSEPTPALNRRLAVK